VLVIARREGEGVFVGDGIRVVVVGVSEGVVRLGFEGPSNVAFSRDGAYTEAEHREFQSKRVDALRRPRPRA
jgi:carbon storage regulator CsrA